jgi:hypothetical protein
VPPVEKTRQFVAVIRHPYDIELSSYNFYRNGMDNALKSMLRFPSERQKIELAQGSISEFVEKIGYFRPGIRIQDYFLVDGELLPNVSLVRFEELATQIPLISRPYCSDLHIKFPHRNKSIVSSGSDKLTREELSQHVKDKIVQKHEWLFENGYYLA